MCAVRGSQQSAPHSSCQGPSRRHSPGVEHGVFPGDAQRHVNTSVPEKDIPLHSTDRSQQVAKPSSPGQERRRLPREALPGHLWERDAIEFEQKWHPSHLPINTRMHTRIHTHNGLLHRASCLAKGSIPTVPFDKVRDLRMEYNLGQGALCKC